MRSNGIDEFVQYLTAAGVAPRHIRRAAGELQDHYDDLKADALDRGFDAHAAAEYADRQLGNLQPVATAFADDDEFLCWSHRHPAIARWCLPIAYVALLPAVPFIAGASNAPSIARWGASMMLGAAVTAGLLLAMQLSILLT